MAMGYTDADEVYAALNITSGVIKSALKRLHKLK